MGAAGRARDAAGLLRACAAISLVYLLVVSADGLLMAMFTARLVVQLPLYYAENVTALGVTRLVMGTPLYAAVLWLAWLSSRPRPAQPAD